MSNSQFDQLEREQQVKAAMYYTIKQIAREVQEEMEVTMSPQLLATLSESLGRQTQCYAFDLENFAKHARRTTVSVDDVRLLARRNPALLQHMNTLVDEQTAQKETSKQATKKPKPKSKSAQAQKDGGE